MKKFAFRVAFLTLGLPCYYAFAAPQNADVVTGNVEIQGAGTPQVQINQSTDRAIINWNSFNIGRDESVQFVTPGAQAATLNRVTGGDPSEILGHLSSNGQLWLINPNGIMFGESAVVNVAGLMASTLNITDHDFMSGNYHFSQDGSNLAKIVNAGQINASEGGYVTFLAPQIANSGIITARLGTVALGAGTEASVQLQGNRLLAFTVSQVADVPMYDEQGNLVAAINHTGELHADGGTVLMTAESVNHLLDQSINVNGIVKADTVAERGGKIVLLARGDTIVNNASLSAQGLNAGEAGGKVEVIGRNVALLGNTDVNAAGGEIRIGRDDSDPNAFEAEVTVIAQNISLRGNFVETSGRYLDQQSSSIYANTWLLDPYNLTISTSANVNPTNPSGSPFSPSGGTSNLNVNTLEEALATANVIVQTGGDAGAGNGNITIANNTGISYSSAHSLTLDAYGNIEIGSTSDPINNPTISNAGTGSITLKAGYGAGTHGTSGTITFDSGGAIYSNGALSLLSIGLISQAGTTNSDYIDVNGLSIDAGGGDVNLQGINSAATLSIANAGTVNFIDSNETAAASRPNLTITGISATGDENVTENSAYNAAGAINVAGNIDASGHQLSLVNTNNNINDDGGVGSIVAGSTILSAGSTLDDVDAYISLSNSNNNFGALNVSAYGANSGDGIVLADGNNAGVTLHTITNNATGANLSVTSTGPMLLTGDISSDSLSLAATDTTSGYIQQTSGTITTTGTSSFESYGARVVSNPPYPDSYLGIDLLENYDSSNQFNALSMTSHYDGALVQADGIGNTTVIGSTNNGLFNTQIKNGDLTVGSAGIESGGGSLQLSINGTGNIALNGNLTTSQLISLDANGGSITQQAGTTLSGPVAMNNASTATLNNTGALVLGDINVTSLNVTASDEISQADSTAITTTGTTTLNAGDNRLALGAITAAGLTVIGGNVTQNAAITTSGGAVTITSTGDFSQSADGSIITGSGASWGNVTIHAGTGSGVGYGTMNLAGTVEGNVLCIDSGSGGMAITGDLTQSGTLISHDTNTSMASMSILNYGSGDIIQTSNGVMTLLFPDSRNIGIALTAFHGNVVQAGTLDAEQSLVTLKSEEGDHITQDDGLGHLGSITAGTTTILGQNGATANLSGNNSLGLLIGSSAGDLTINDVNSSGLALDTVALDGNLAITAKSISEPGESLDYGIQMSGTGKTANFVVDSGGAVNLNQPGGNDFGGNAVSIVGADGASAGAITLNDSSVLGLNLAAVNTGSPATITAQAITLSDNFDAGSNTVNLTTTGTGITAGNHAINFSTGTLTAGDINLTTASGGIFEDFGTINSSGTMSIAASDGAADGGNSVDFSNTPGNLFGTVNISNAGDVNLFGMNVYTISGINSTGNISAETNYAIDDPVSGTLAVSGAIITSKSGGTISLSNTRTTAEYGIQIDDGGLTNNGIDMAGSIASSNGNIYIYDNRNYDPTTPYAANMNITGSISTTSGSVALEDFGAGTIILADGANLNGGSNTALSILSDNGSILQTGGTITSAPGVSLSAVGDVTLTSATNDFGDLLNASGNNITLVQDGTLNLGNITANGNVVLAATQLNNTVGADAITVGSNKVWQIFLTNLTGNTFDGLASGNQAVWGKSYPDAISLNGNRYIFATAQTLSLTPLTPFSISKTYGDTITLPTPTVNSNYQVSGFVNAADYDEVFTQDTSNNVVINGLSFASAGASAAALPGAYTSSLAGGDPTATGYVAQPINTTSYGTVTVSSANNTNSPLSLTSGAQNSPAVANNPASVSNWVRQNLPPPRAKKPVKVPELNTQPTQEGASQ